MRNRKIATIFLSLVLVFIILAPQQALAQQAGPLANAGIVITDQSTPATAIRTTNVGNMAFVSSSGAVVGRISNANYTAFINRNIVLVEVSPGVQVGVAKAELGVPPTDWGGSDWNAWFVVQFNLMRGITSSNLPVTQTDRDYEAERIELVRLVNIERAREGLSPLTAHEDLMRPSQVRAREASVLWSHTRPDGSYHEVGAGEVLHCGSSTPEAALRSWMNSPRHRAIIMNPNRVYIGTGIHGNCWQMYIALEIF